MQLKSGICLLQYGSVHTVDENRINIWKSFCRLQAEILGREEREEESTTTFSIHNLALRFRQSDGHAAMLMLSRTRHQIGFNNICVLHIRLTSEEKNFIV